MANKRRTGGGGKKNSIAKFTRRDLKFGNMIRRLRKKFNKDMLVNREEWEGMHVTERKKKERKKMNRKINKWVGQEQRLKAKEK